MKKMLVFSCIVLAFAHNTQAQENNALPLREPVSCVITHIDADKDPKPIKELGEDSYAYSKRLMEWQKREDLRNPKIPEPVPPPAPKMADIVSVAEKQRINPIQYILDKGWTTKEQILAAAPHFPFLIGEATNDNIIDYQQMHLATWMEVYPQEVESFFSKVISREKIDEVPEFME